MRTSVPSKRKAYAAVAAAVIAVSTLTGCTGSTGSTNPTSAVSAGAPASGTAFAAAAKADTSTPVKHLVVIFQENVSYDHYFGTYPTAANTDGTPFHAARVHPQRRA